MKQFRNSLLALTCIACLSNQAFAKMKMSQSLTVAKTGKTATEETITANRANTLVEVYENALEKNIPYLLNDKNYQAVLTRIAQAKSHLKPQVSADGHVGYNTVRSGGVGSNYGSASAGINASWVIYNKELKLNVGIAELDAQMAERQLALAQQDLMALIADSYLKLILKEDQVRLLGDKVKDLAKLVQFTQTRVSQGVLSRDQVSYVKADHKRAQLKLGEAMTERDEALGVFEHQFGVTFKPYLSAMQATIPAINTQSRTDWMNEASNNSFKVQISKLAAEIASKDIKKAKSLYSPIVTLNANVSTNRGTQYNNNQFGQDRSTGASVGATINIPLYDGGLRSAATKEQVIRKESVQLEGDLASRQAQLDADKAINDYSSAVGGIISYREVISLTEDVVTSTREAFNSGNSDYTKLLMETGKLYDYKYDLAQANIRALSAYIQLKHAAGSLNLEDLGKISLSLNLAKVISRK